MTYKVSTTICSGISISDKQMIFTTFSNILLDIKCSNPQEIFVESAFTDLKNKIAQILPKFRITFIAVCWVLITNRNISKRNSDFVSSPQRSPITRTFLYTSGPTLLSFVKHALGH